MNAKRLNHWAEVFDGKAWEYDSLADDFLQDQDLVRDAGRDYAEGMAEEFRLKAARARSVAAKLRSRISN
jgi:hypothetical protein